MSIAYDVYHDGKYKYTVHLDGAHTSTQPVRSLAPQFVAERQKTQIPHASIHANTDRVVTFVTIIAVSDVVSW